MLTLGIPYMLIYVQIISPVFMLLILPIAIALTAVFMFLLVAVIDDVSIDFTLYRFTANFDIELDGI